MGTGFTDKEKERIYDRLRAAAVECMAVYGIKKTSVDQLVQKVGISKGAFYKFYDSKELLFFEVIVGMHVQLYDKAREILIHSIDLSKKERLKVAFMEAFELMKQTSMANIMENEMEYLLRKIPEPLLQQHCQDDRTNIESLMNASGFTFLVSSAELSAAISILFMSLVHRKSIGASFDKAFEMLVYGLCDKIIE